MKVGLQMLGGSTLLGSAEVINNGCTFLRNLILARLLSKADFGVAATLALVVSLFELGGKMSFGQQMIRSKSGDDPLFERGTHACQVLGGLLDAALILAFSFPLAHWFGMEAHRGALMLMALIPLCSGFSSLENYRLLRHLRFAPLVLSDTLPQVIITLAAWPLAAWFRDYRAILCLLLIKAGFSLVTSHLVAERSYRLSWEPKLVKDNLRFGWPLLASGYLMFAAFQGDRMLIAGAYSMSDLGVYAVASTLAMTPCFVIFRISGTVSLPVMARVQSDPAKFRSYYCLYAEGLALFAAVFVVGMILGGEPAITLLFGQKYREAGALATWLAFGQVFRILRGAPVCAAMARGDTVNTLVSNVWRLSGLILAVPVVLLKLDLRWVAVAGGVGELVAFIAALVRMRRKHAVPFRFCLNPAGLVVALAVAACFGRAAFDPGHTASRLAIAVLGCGISVGVFCAFFAGLRKMSLLMLSAIRLRLREIAKNGGLRGADPVATGSD